jgi:hypothetical protein
MARLAPPWEGPKTTATSTPSLARVKNGNRNIDKICVDAVPRRQLANSLRRAATSGVAHGQKGAIAL